ncbi:hypothetical protein SAMN06265349_102822 [Flavobacterium resistens]|uniref:Lipoprotein n=1 Tax=Flavobacterium resistens TaxID=443612 RepID=A0A521CR58_9FLAO|nr:hypothetical protein [Flavobacterium resistens]MRX66896.1 hypothetical protein [Flavobacterium resistens]SMO61944.1 hypothetical protein SAMN06265349_102822 [Flavobacterium resistens]
MKHIFFNLIILLLFTSCEKKEPKNINIKFSSEEAFDSDYLKRNESQTAELITHKKTEKGIEIIVEKYETGGLIYYGDSKIMNDTLFLYYWINTDPMDISAVLIPKRFKYEIKNVSYKQIKFEYLGNKFKNNTE